MGDEIPPKPPMAVKPSKPSMPQSPLKLSDWLIRRFPQAKKQNLKRMVEAGRVSINGVRAIALRQNVYQTDQVDVDERPKDRSLPPPPGLNIIYEDEDLLVADKPPGLLTSTGPREQRPTLFGMVQEYVTAANPRLNPGLIHRLDRDASGLLIFSKTAPAYHSLKTQFFQHAVTRQYLAVVHGRPDPAQGRIETRLIEKIDGTIHSTRQAGKGQVAITEYETLGFEKKRSWLRVTLQTGRKHQIRAHLKERNCPIVGDAMYGREDDDAPRLMLAAVRLTILHPRDAREITWTLPTPEGFPAMPAATAAPEKK